MANVDRPIGNAAVADRSIIWLGDLKEQQKYDVLHSTLFAQVAADAQFPVDNEEKASQWHARFVEILGTIGWVIQKSDTTSIEDNIVEGPVTNTILHDIKADNSAGTELYTSVTTGLIEPLRAGHYTEAENVLDQASISSSAHFAGVQLAVTGGGDSSPVVTLFAYFYSASNDIGAALWHPVKKASTQHFKKFFVQMTLNESVYESGVRERIIEKLEEAGKMHLMVPLCESNAV